MSSTRVRIMLLAFSAASVLLFQNCGRFVNTTGLGNLSQDLASKSPGGAGTVSEQAFAKTLHTVLVQNCAGCHGSFQQPLHSLPDPILAHQNVIAANLVDLTTPASSRLVAKIALGHSGKSVNIANEIQTSIEAWSAQLKAAGVGAPPPPTTTTTMPPVLTGGAQVSAEIFARTLHPVLRKTCAGCHGVSQQPLHSVENPASAHENINNAGVVNLLNPGSSRLVQKIAGGLHNGISATVSADIETQIKLWATQLEAAGGAPPPPPQLEATYKSINAMIIGPKCTGCHGATKAEKDLRLHTYALLTGTGGWFKEITDRAMPPPPEENGSGPLSAEEIEIIRKWRAAGSPNN
jgi:hypothetical protein